MTGGSVRERGESGRRPDSWVAVLGPATALWLAAVPQWTVALAKEAELPLTPDMESVDDLVQFTHSAGVTARRKEPAPDGGAMEVFWVDEASRKSWMTDLAFQFEDFGETVGTIADRVAAAGRKTRQLPALTRRWLDLIYSESGQSGPVLFRDIAKLVASDELAEAAALADAAAVLAPVPGGSYPAAVTRGRRLLQAGYRRRRDREALADFVRPDEQVTQLVDLVTSKPGQPWAVHLLGPGGIGKTMLLRYLASDLFAQENEVSPFTVARIDFDHISPDYPVDRPVQLLTELADDIIVGADAEISERRLRAFFASAESVNAAAVDSPLSPDDPLVKRTVRLFAEYLKRLPAPQVLVLDTCEELAKLHPADTEVPAVTRTFELLHDVWEQCPTVRVVFAGRRYLASSGAGWTLPEHVTQRAVVSLARRDYLRLARQKGFLALEAETLLKRPHPVTGEVPSEAFVRAVLHKSPEVGSEGWLPEDGRYNPFIVAHYRKWWEDEPELSPQQITAAGPDAYVAGRIVLRLRDRDVLTLLPALILLGRFDEVMLATAMGEPPGSDRVKRVVELLAEQEWIEASTDAISGLRVLVVSQGMLPMLRVWARRPEQQPRLAAARDRLVGPLRDRLERASLSTLSAELVMAALREYSPGPSALVWAEVEARVEREARWDWAANVVPRVRAELEADLTDDPLLDAALSATALAAQWRDRPAADMSAAWAKVSDLLRHTSGPLPPEVDAWRSQLAARAELGRLRAGPATADLVRSLLDLLAGRTAAPLASVVAVLESVLGPLATIRRIRLGLAAEAVRAAEAMAGLAGEDPAVVVGGLVALAALVPYGEREPILLRADERAAATGRETAGRNPAAWADRPLFDRRDPRVWLALHRAAAALATETTVDKPTLAAWNRLADRGRAGDVDADRLAGCCMELRSLLRDGPGTGPGDLPTYDPAVRPSDAVHEETPARFVAAARSLYRAGQPAKSEGVLDDWRKRALDARTEDATIRAADEALAWLAIRMRRPDYRPTAMSVLLSRPPGASSALAGALRVFVDGDSSLPPDEVIAELTSLTPPWLGGDIALELAVAFADEPPTTAVRERVEQLRRSDPVTACHLATALALRQRRDGAGEPDTVELVSGLYAAIPATTGLPPWGCIGADSDPADPWSGWRARWALLDGSAPERGTPPVLFSPELRPPSSGPQPGTGPAIRRRTRRLVAPAALLVAAGAGAVGVAGGGVYIVLAAVGLDETAAAAGVAAAVVGALGAIISPGRVGAALRRRLTRAFVLAVTVFPDPHLEVSAEQRVHYGRVFGGRGLWRWPVIIDRKAPRLLRRWGPAPGADGCRVEPPLSDRVLSHRSFRRAATVLDQDASGHADDWEHDLMDADAEQAYCCVWVRTVEPTSPRSWPKPSAVLHVPEEWAGRLRKAYGPLIGAPAKEARAAGRADLAATVRIDHRMGLPVDTRSGPVLQITQGEDIRTGRDQSFWPSYAPASAVTWPPAWLIVVEVTPVDGPFDRDPSMADLTRRLALDIQRETGSWVLVLPAVPPVIAEEIWQTLARFARRRRHARRWHLVTCVGEVKRAIVDSSLPGAKRQVAQDVLLIGPWWAS